MPAAPPKKLKSEIVHLNQSLHHIERQQHAGIQRAPDSLPVLEAFQEYLARERQRANRRLAAMVALFAFILLGLGGVSVGVVLLLADRMSRQAVSFSEQTRSLEGELGALVGTTDDSIAGIQTTLSSLQAGLLTSQQDQQTQQASRHAVDSNLTTRIDHYAGALTALTGELEALRTHNATVQARLAAITNELAVVAARPAGPPLPPANFDPANRALTEAPSAPSASTTAPTSDRRLPVESITLPIVPPGETAPVKWRIPYFKPTT